MQRDLLQFLFSPQVIVIEPFFDGYETITQIAEGVPVYVPLRPVGQELVP